MSKNLEYTVQLKPEQYEFLKQMVTQYNLPDESKALRCLINFAITETQHRDDIFQTVRCLYC